MSSRAVTGGRDLSHGRSIRSAAISARMTPIGRSVAGGARHVGVLPDHVDARGGLPQRQVDDQSAHAVAGRLVADVGPLRCLGAASIQGLGVELGERPPDPRPELGDGEVARQPAEPGARSRRRPSACRGPEQVDEGPHLAHVDPALVERAPGAAQLVGEDQGLDEQRLGLDLGTAADERQLGRRAFRSSPPARPAAGADCRGRDRRGDRTSSVALDGGGAARGGRSRRPARRHGGLRGHRRPRCRRRARSR